MPTIDEIARIAVEEGITADDFQGNLTIDGNGRKKEVQTPGNDIGYVLVVAQESKNHEVSDANGLEDIHDHFPTPISLFYIHPTMNYASVKLSPNSDGTVTVTVEPIMCEAVGIEDSIEGYNPGTSSGKTRHWQSIWRNMCEHYVGHIENSE